MSLRAGIFKRIFTFNFDARTSRGPMKERTSWFIKIRDEKNPGVAGVGECAPLPGLSIDDRPDLENVLYQVAREISKMDNAPAGSVFSIVRSIIPEGFPSISFSVETALLDLLHGGRRIIFVNDFIKGKPLPINGLVWMGDEDFMLEQVFRKVRDGFRCIKFKVGGLDFNKECRMLETVRKQYPDIEIRLDANGAFGEEEALKKLNTLSAFNIHSIEQPVKPGALSMPEICEQSPIPVALDEELIGKEGDKNQLLDRIKPAFIILKPSLHGGLSHCEEWIRVAEEKRIGWWVTSALESAVGLNAICQFAANYNLMMPQGLGTGSLFTNNFHSPLRVVNGNIFWDPGAQWEIQDAGTSGS